jgi:IMP dehydrogenase
MYTFSDVLIKPKYSTVLSRKTVSMISNMKNIYLSLPIIAANMKTICGPKMAIAMAKAGGLGILHRFNSVENAIDDFKQVQTSLRDDNFGLYPNIGVSIGVQEEDKERFRLLYNAGARIIAIDVAHGHHILVKMMIQWLKSLDTKDIVIIAGNIATPEAAIDLSNWGADILKVGIGPGSVCTTRSRTGVGVPQLYALEKIANTIEHEKLPVNLISDGGISNIGDIPKALKYADAVMIGSMIAGTSETPGNVFRDANGQFYKCYGGSASGENKGHNQFVEGMMKTIPFRGKVKYILQEMKEGIQSSFSYVGANNLSEFQQKCELIPISGNSSRESKF